MIQQPAVSAPATKRVELSNLPVENPDNVRPIYANFVGVINSSLDVRLNFSEVFVVSANTSPRHELRASIVLTKEQTKSLLAALQTIVSQIDAK